MRSEVFAHEFGHAFSLPDLYDTSHPQNTQQDGNWDLMSDGAWGGDDATPSSPSHMSAWSKAFLGWIKPREVTANSKGLSLRNVETFPEAVKIPISSKSYYLLEARAKTGFDRSLKGPELLVWKVDEDAVNAGLPLNKVNADATKLGLELLQADGKHQLDSNAGNRGDDGDPFPGSSLTTSLSNSTEQFSLPGIALCNIKWKDNAVTFDVQFKANTCQN